MSDSIARMFPGTAQLVADDGATSMRVWSAVMALLFLGWSAWFVAARVPIFAVSDAARFEAATAHWIEAPVAGQLRTVRGAVGQSVKAGDVLFELDARAERLREAEQSLQQATASERAELLDAQLAAATATLNRMREVARAAAIESKARYDEASELARLADSQAARGRQLFRNGLVSKAELDALDADAAGRRATAATQAAAMQRGDAEQKVSFDVKQADVDRLRADLAAARAAIGTSSLAGRILEHDAERRLLRAPVAGRIASDSGKRAGSFVQEGERLTSIVPAGAVAIVAWFRPEQSMGRIRAGQRARFRLDAFPPVEYGWIEGRVQSIGSEPKDGRVRVDVLVTRRPARIPLEHGLTGSLEVETDAVSPMTLVLRAAGKRT